MNIYILFILSPPFSCSPFLSGKTTVTVTEMDKNTDTTHCLYYLPRFL